MTNIRIDIERLLADLETLRSFGACGTGVKRRAFSEADLASRRWLAGRMSQAGLVVHVDAVGNLFGLPGDQKDCILIGSHSDTQPEGGWLDGAYGVIVGLELARASRESGGPNIACVSFQDEEGRFSTLTGSRIWSGRLSLAEADALEDSEGLRFADARRRLEGIATTISVPPDRFRAFLEIHIEQGPVLDKTGIRIGVVDSIVGIRGERMSFSGQQNHAGTTPMHLRKDAFQGLVRFVSLLDERLSEVVTEATVWTIGQVTVHPNAASVVPGKVDFSIQWRDADEDRLAKMQDVIHATAKEIAQAVGLEWSRSDYASIAPTRCDRELVGILERAAQTKSPGLWRKLNSGALHDAANVSARMPMAMLFVPSIGGISHNFDEDTSTDDLVLGAEVMAEAIGLMTPRI